MMHKYYFFILNFLILFYSVFMVILKLFVSMSKVEPAISVLQILFSLSKYFKNKVFNDKKLLFLILKFLIFYSVFIVFLKYLVDKDKSISFFSFFHVFVFIFVKEVFSLQVFSDQIVFSFDITYFYSVIIVILKLFGNVKKSESVILVFSVLFSLSKYLMMKLFLVLMLLIFYSVILKLFGSVKKSKSVILVFSFLFSLSKYLMMKLFLVLMLLIFYSVIIVVLKLFGSVKKSESVILVSFIFIFVSEVFKLQVFIKKMVLIMMFLIFYSVFIAVLKLFSSLKPSESVIFVLIFFFVKLWLYLMMSFVI